MAVAIRRAAAARSGGVTATAAMTASRRRRLSTAPVRPTPPRQLYFLRQEANSPTGVARAQWMSQVNTSLEASDPEIFEIVEREKTRQVRACGDPTPPLGLTRQGQASGARVRADDRPAADPVGGEHLATLCHPALRTARRRP